MAFNWKALIPILETAGNIAEIVIPGGAAFIPLTEALEQAVNPLLESIGQGNVDVTSEVMAAYGTMIAVLTILKHQTSLDPATLAKIQVYIEGAQNATAAYLTAGKGYDPSLYTPVTPIP